MDEVKFLAFGESHINSIGTAHLGGCSAVMIVSKHAAILAHIPPRPSSDLSDVHAGDRHCQKMMDEVAASYKAKRKYFPKDDSWVLCAVYKGEVALPDQQKIMNDSLVRLGLAPSLVTYAVGTNGVQGEFPGQGTVYIDGSGPFVYVEDSLVHEGGTQSARSEASASTSQRPGALYYPQQAASSYYSASTSQSPVQYSQSAASEATWVYIHDDVIWLAQKGNEYYYYFRYNGKKYETKSVDWREEETVYNGQGVRCWAYTGKQTGTKYYRWSMENITMTHK